MSMYTVGVSTGMWGIGKDPQLVGLAAKLAYGATVGVQFVQLDLETTAEFKEPQLKYKVKRVIDELGLKEVGLHGEISGDLMAVDSALRRHWESTHIRLCEGLRGANDMGFIYFLVHASGRPQLLFEEERYIIMGNSYPVVGPDGKPLSSICDKSPAAKNMIKSEISEGILDREVGLRQIQREKFARKYAEILGKVEADIRKMVSEDTRYQNLPDFQKENIIRQSLREADSSIREQAQEQAGMTSEELYGFWKNSRYNLYLLVNSEIGAYQGVAAAMIESNDPLWKNICGDNDVLNAYSKKHGTYNAAVAAKYLEGHLTAKNGANDDNLDGMSIKEYCEEHGIYFLIEVPEAGGGLEGRYRLFDPRHLYHLIKKLNSPRIKLCLDFEHMLSHKLDPDKVIDDMPGDAGKHVLLFHLGKPTAYGGTTHAHIYLGSRSQEIIYRWMHKLKKKGMEKAYLLYERGGGQSTQEVFRDSVQSMRQIAAYLEKDVKPDDLPPEFFGLSVENRPKFQRQLVTVREHAFDPLAGMLMVPEETHTFLGARARELGKLEEWKKGQFR